MKQTLILAAFWSLCNLSLAQERTWGEWHQWGAQPDSTYINPIIPADYSDLDCIRVGDDYYAISSTMQFSPGMTVLHSRNLVDWEICGHAVEDITQIGPELSWNRMNRYGRGVWAGTLRYHNGQFYVFFGTPDEGYFMTKASSPQGPWEPLTPLLSEPGWDDCSALWDDDGKAYFVGTHFADGYKTYLFDMSEDGTKINLKSKRLINEGNRREANKLLKVNDWYYLIFSEFNSKKGRYVMAKRSKKITGPYAEEKQLALPGREAYEPNQGGIVLGKDNQWYFFTHHGKSGDWSGRVASLLPVTWVDDWPIIGKVLPEKIGAMVWKGKMPSLESNHCHIQRSDDFDTGRLGPQWQWNYQPRKEMYSLSERPGWMRLKAFIPLKANQLKYAGNTLTQRCFRTPHNCVTTKIDISHMQDGQKSGLCHFSSQQSAAIGVIQTHGKRYLELRTPTEMTTHIQLKQPFIWLRSEWGLDGLSTFSYSLDGDRFIPIGKPYQMIWKQYRGDRPGIYNFNDNGEEGFIDIDYFHYSF